MFETIDPVSIKENLRTNECKDRDSRKDSKRQKTSFVAKEDVAYEKDGISRYLRLHLIHTSMTDNDLDCLARLSSDQSILLETTQQVSW